ncbi:hypothetical protein RJ639_030690 [Escallonia herrerae]|uniref:Uncharacterized protein n=1 Tax=Escallonia herrerae TaxID=1293975 RepID=A0AA89BNC0_9ASTE|nr:hypothetical protein RJ639_030690 [Escallonia herrerae]
MEGGEVILTLKDQSILTDGDIKQEVDMLEDVEIGELEEIQSPRNIVAKIPVKIGAQPPRISRTTTANGTLNQATVLTGNSFSVLEGSDNVEVENEQPSPSANNKKEIRAQKNSRELDGTVAKLEKSNRELATVKAERDAAKSGFFPIILGNKHVPSDRVRDKHKDLQDLESSLKDLLEEIAVEEEGKVFSVTKLRGGLVPKKGLENGIKQWSDRPPVPFLRQDLSWFEVSY